MISSKELSKINPITNEITALWDTENVIPCCKEFPSHLVNYLKTLGRPTKLKAVARWNIENLQEFQEEIDESGFLMIQNPSGKKNSSDKKIQDEIMKNLRETLSISHLVLITGDIDYLGLLKTVPDTEIILICNPFTLASEYKEEGFQIVPYFELCSCENAKKLENKWKSPNLNTWLVDLFIKFFKDPTVSNTLSSIGKNIREVIRPSVGDLDWKKTRFTKMKDIAEETGIDIS